MKCPICKGTLAEDVKKCKYCGYDFNEKNIESENEYEEIGYEEEKNAELWKDDIVYGLASIMISIVATATAIKINDGLGLIIPFLMYVASIEISIRHRKIVSFIGLLISGFGIALIILEAVKFLIL